MNYPIPKIRTLLWRGCRKKCPQCGQFPMFQRWITLHEHCPGCGLKHLPDQGDLWGVLLFADRLLFIIPFIVLFYFRLYHPSLVTFFILGGAMVFTLVFTLPNRLGASLAIDYLIRRKSGDLVDQDSPEDAAKPKTE